MKNIRILIPLLRNRISTPAAPITELLGADLAVNGTFEAPGTGWLAAGEATINTGVGRVYSSAGAYSDIKQESQYLVIGKLYRVDFDVVYNVNTNNLANSSGSQIYDNLTTGVSKTFYYTADSVQLAFKRVNGGVTDIQLDNIVVREVLYQRAEFDAALTTPSAGALTNVYGDPWVVTRNSVGKYFDSSDGLLKESAINVPRIENNAILIETQRKNYFRWSNDFTQTPWNKVSGTSIIVANQAISPDGTTNADLIHEDSISGEKQISHYVTASGIDNSKRHTFSGFIKSAGRTFGRLKIYDATDYVIDCSVNFDLTDVNHYTFTDIDVPEPSEFSLTDVGSGWFYFKYSFTLGGTGVIMQPMLYFCNTFNNSIYLGDGASGFYIYQWQLEEGVPASSPIYTESVVNGVTREADVITMTVPVGATRMIEWIDGVEQTSFAVTPGDTITMKNGTTKIVVDDGVPVIKLEFDAALTTPSAGALTSVVGDDWAVARNSPSSIRSNTDTLTLLAAHEPKIENGKVLIEPAFTQRGLGTDQIESATFWSNRATITANNINSIDGTQNAEKVECSETSTFSTYVLWNRTMPNQDTQPTTAMFFIKPGNQTNVLMTATYAGQVYDVWFNLTGAGVKGSTNARTGTGITYIDHGVEYWSDGWYRCWLTVQDSQTALSLGIRAGMVNADLSTTSTLGDYIYACHWNVIEGSTLRNYMLNLTGTDKYAEADVITNTVPVGASTMETWIDGVSDGGQAVTPGATVTMLNGTTKIIIT